MIEFEIDTSSLRQAIIDLANTQPEISKALNTTLRKMASWVRTQSTRGLSKELAVQQKIIRRRLKTAKLKRTGSGASVIVWHGLNPIPLIYLKARETRAGVKASGGRFVAGSFIARAKSGNLQVFKRRGRKRLPIDKQTADIAGKAENYIENKVVEAALFEAQFYKIFEHELQWQTRTR